MGSALYSSARFRILPQHFHLEVVLDAKHGAQ
jgi:hypothetical protein